MDENFDPIWIKISQRKQDFHVKGFFKCRHLKKTSILRDFGILATFSKFQNKLVDLSFSKNTMILVKICSKTMVFLSNLDENCRHILSNLFRKFYSKICPHGSVFLIHFGSKFFIQKFKQLCLENKSCSIIIEDSWYLTNFVKIHGFFVKFGWKFWSNLDQNFTKETRFPCERFF